MNYPSIRMKGLKQRGREAAASREGALPLPGSASSGPLIGGRADVEGLLAALESLSDLTRLRLLSLLERHELGVGELCEVLRLPQSTVSRHLKVLGEQGWLAFRRAGTFRLYRMGGTLDSAARRLWKVARSEAQGSAALRQDALRLARKLAARGQADAFFAGAAGEWERLRAELYGTTFFGEALLAFLPRELTVVDLGCGTADLTLRLSRHVGRVHAVDRSAAMLAWARRRLKGIPNVQLHQADLGSLPLDDASCDAALFALTLSYLAEPSRALSEAARVIKPGGVLALADLVRHDDDAFRRRMGQATLGFDSPDLSRLLEQAGFDALRYQPLPPERGAQGPALFTAHARRSPEPARGARRFGAA
ncbi:MAG TPA: metalloregulator ArsR/SmtB family transcription factor [Anaeromyxobacteraceae bacterium]|nr:metalloregulator ArsR/SmtB family transcription factor [Anaeromyxobacteraceae bacterium]